MNFTAFEPPMKVFSMKFGMPYQPYDRFKNSAKNFSAKWSLPTDL